MKGPPTQRRAEIGPFQRGMAVLMRTRLSIRHWLAAALGLALLAAIGPAPAFAQDAVGRLSRAEGVVLVLRDGTTEPLSVGREVLRGDRIMTSPQSRGEITLLDSTMVIIGPSSTVEAVALVTDAAGVRQQGTLDLISGIVRSLVTPGGAFDVQTRAAVASVRSTEFVVEVTAPQVSVFVADGVVAVVPLGTAATPGDLDDEAAGAVVGESADTAPPTLSAGQGIDVVGGEGMGGVREWGDQRIADVVGRTTLQ